MTHFPLFARFLVILLVLTGPAASAQHADIYRILNGERESLQCRWDLIRQARSEILLSTYAIKDDVIGLGTLQLLIEAAERGVPVRLLLDNFGNELPACLLTQLEARHVRVKLFNIANPFQLRTAVDRMHGKMLIVDGESLIVGGRNLKAEYYLLDSANNFLDREVYIVSDSAVQQARRHFEVLWNNPKLSKRKSGKLSDAQSACWQAALEQAPAFVRKQLTLAPIGQRNWQANIQKTAHPVHFIHDNYSYRQKHRGSRWRARKDRQATDQLIALVASARSTLDLENSYFLPTRRWRRAFRECQARGVKMRLVTNSSYTSDVPLVEAVYLNRRAWALRHGIEVWEYRGKKALHTKAMVIDAHISVIGSYNLEKLSHKYNSEVMAWVDDARLAGQHAGIMAGVLKESRQVGGKTGAFKESALKPTKAQRKRHRKTQILRYTLAPLAGLIL